MLKISMGEKNHKIYLTGIFFKLFFYFLGQNSTQFFINLAIFLFLSLNQSFNHYSYDQTWTNYEEPIRTVKL